jgi:predicted MFS family arabinose efflux permease
MGQLAPFIAMIAYSLLGNSAMAAQPMIVGGIVDVLGLTERQAGFVSAAEMFGFAAGMLMLCRYVVHIDRRHIALAAVAVMMAANAASPLASAFAPLAILRFLSGYGAAMAYSVFLTIAAATPRPERSFAVVNATSIICTGVLLWAAPHIMAKWSLGGMFMTIVGLAAAVGLTMPAVPRASPGAAMSAPSLRSILQLPRGERAALGLVLFTMFALYVGHGSIWSYQERIGVEMGLPAKQVGTLLGTSMMVWGVLGSAIATVVGLSLGRVWPQVISLGLSVVAALMLVLTKSPLGFGVACALVALSWFYGLPYQMGLLARFDPYGRANLAGSLMTTFGAAVGPALAALLLGYGGYLAIGALAGICYLVALVLVLPAALKVNGLVRPSAATEGALRSAP